VNRVWTLCLLASLTGCYKINYTTGSEFNSKADSIKWHHTAVAGMIEISQPVAIDSICPDGWGRIHHERSPLNLLASYGSAAVLIPLLARVPVEPGSSVATGVTFLSAFPSLIYTPASVTVHCKSGTTYRVPASPENLEALAAGFTATQ
jgi:hypothetical protein